MSYVRRLSEAQWRRIRRYIPGEHGGMGRPAEDNRRFVEAVIWMTRSGGRWRDLPPEYGKWSSVHKRFLRWSRMGIWEEILNVLAKQADEGHVMIDSSIVRAHQDASGGEKGGHAVR